MARIAYHGLPDSLSPLANGRGPANLLRILAHAEGVWPSYVQFGRALFANTSLSPRLRELVIIKVGHLQSCPYEVWQHESLARELNVSDRALQALSLKGELPPEDFDERERASLQLVCAVVSQNPVSSEVFALAHSHLGDRGITELLLLTSQYAGLALFINTLNIEIEVSNRDPSAEQPAVSGARA